MKDGGRSETAGFGEPGQGGRRHLSGFSGRVIGREGDIPKWWADVLNGRVRRDWELMREPEEDNDWARR